MSYFTHYIKKRYMVFVLKAVYLAAELEKSWREKFKHERGIKALTSFPFTPGGLAIFIKKGYLIAMTLYWSPDPPIFTVRTKWIPPNNARQCHHAKKFFGRLSSTYSRFIAAWHLR